MTIYEFADVIGKDLLIRRYANQKGRFMVRFEHCDVKDGIFLRGAHGNAPNMVDAISAYIAEIAGQELIFNGNTDREQSYRAPSNLTVE
jgi:hypothetical protein